MYFSFVKWKKNNWNGSGVGKGKPNRYNCRCILQINFRKEYIVCESRELDEEMEFLKIFFLWNKLESTRVTNPFWKSWIMTSLQFLVEHWWMERVRKKQKNYSQALHHIVNAVAVFGKEPAQSEWCSRKTLGADWHFGFVAH